MGGFSRVYRKVFFFFVCVCCFGYLQSDSGEVPRMNKLGGAGNFVIRFQVHGRGVKPAASSLWSLPRSTRERCYKYVSREQCDEDTASHGLQFVGPQMLAV